MEGKKIIIIGGVVVTAGVLVYLWLRSKNATAAAATSTTPAASGGAAASTPAASTPVASTPAASIPATTVVTGSPTPIAGDILPTSTVQTVFAPTPVTTTMTTATAARSYLQSLANTSYYNQIVNTTPDAVVIGLANWAKNGYLNKVFTSPDPNVNAVILALRAKGYFILY